MEQAALAQQIQDWSDNPEPHRAKDTFGPEFKCGAAVFTPIAVDRVGKVVIRFGVIRKNRPFDSPEKRLEFLRRLNAIPEVNLPEDKADRYPKFELSALLNRDALEEFKATVDWAIEQVNDAQREQSSIAPHSAQS